MKKKALIIVSSADKLPLKYPEGKSVSIGFFLVEMGKVLEVFKDEYEFTFATPDGCVPTIDINGETLLMQTANKLFMESAKLTAELNFCFNVDKYRKNNEEYVNRRMNELKIAGSLMGKLKVSQELPKSNKEVKMYREKIQEYMETLKEHKFMSLKEIIERDNDINDEFKLSQFKFVHMPGGHAPMVDFVDNPYLGEVLNRIYENNILLSLICHAPIGLSSAKYRINKNGEVIKLDDYAYKGANITVFGKFEELQVSIGGFYHVPGEKTRLEFYASDKLKEDGYIVETTMEFLPKVIWDKDKNLLTGNGPQSIDIQTRKLKELLRE